MRLNKIGSFTMASMGQSKNVISDFMKKNKPKGTSFQDGMLKLVRTLPKVLKYLPGDKAADARSFMMSLQVRLKCALGMMFAMRSILNVVQSSACHC